jgi:hypothetical protein
VAKHRKFFAGGVAWAVLGFTASLNAQLVISELYFDPPGVNTGRQVVEIQNAGDTEVNMSSAGFWLYFPPARWQFPSGVIIDPGEAVTVHINRPGESTTTDFFTGISGMRNLRSQGPFGDAIALFSTNLFGDPTKIIDFVEWGGPGNGGEEVAVAAGIWTSGAFIDVSSLRDGASLAYDGTGNATSDWCVDGTPSLGAPNDGCTQAFAQSPVILNEVGYVRAGGGQYHPAVELKNTGSVFEDLGGKWIVLGGQFSYQFPLETPDTFIGPGEILVLHLGVNGTNGPLKFYSGAGTFRDLNASDSLSFHSLSPFTDATAMLDFVQWGAAGSPLEATAVAAHLWTAGERVDSADRRPRGSLAARGVDHGVGRWVIDNTGTIGAENDAPPFVPVVINEILVDPAGENSQRCEVELKNLLTDEPFSLASCKLCLESSAAPGSTRCYAFPASASIQPGSYSIVHLNRAGITSGINVYTGAFQDLETLRGSLTLVVSGNENDPNNLIDYLRWGAEPGYGESLAVSAGIWTAGTSIDVSLLRDGASVAYSGQGDAPDSYRVDTTPSMGQDNVEGVRQSPFRRGDCNDDRKTDISDSIALLNYLFAGGRKSLCADACDSNGDDALDISDPVYLLFHLFNGGPPPPPPGLGPDCGLEPEPRPAKDLTCGSYLSC